MPDYRSPIRAGRISSAYGAPRGGKQHRGTDIAASFNSSVYAIADGVIEYAIIRPTPAFGGYGNVIVQKLGTSQNRALYAHLSKVFVKRGQVVKAGDEIGRVGNTGYSSSKPDATVPVHLHLEVTDRPFPLAPGVGRMDPGKFLLERGSVALIQGSAVTALGDLLAPKRRKEYGRLTNRDAHEIRRSYLDDGDAFTLLMVAAQQRRQQQAAKMVCKYGVGTKLFKFIRADRTGFFSFKRIFAGPYQVVSVSQTTGGCVYTLKDPKRGNSFTLHEGSGDWGNFVTGV